MREHGCRSMTDLDRHVLLRYIGLEMSNRPYPFSSFFTCLPLGGLKDRHDDLRSHSGGGQVHVYYVVVRAQNGLLVERRTYDIVVDRFG